MQCQQPLFGFNLPYSGQYFPSNAVSPCNGFAPNVIGEGEVNSITFPDGSIQYYFLPVRWHSDIYLKRWPPYPFNDNMFYNYSKPNAGIWIIKNFSNTISPVYNQYWQRTNPDAFTKPCFSYDNNAIPPGFQLKFHNDCWTSTTDLHCFCPRIPVVPIVSTGAQAEAPIEIKCCCHTTDYNNLDNDAGCMLNIMKECNKIIKCKCNRIEKKSSSSMSIDHSKTCKTHDSKKREPKKNIVICECSIEDVKKKSTEKTNQPSEKHGHTKPQCICEDVQSPKNFVVQTADKVVFTYKDQASSATDELQKKPKTSHNRRRRGSTEKIIGVYEFSTSSSDCTICK